MASNTKLSDDYIRMVLSMDATEAEQELHKVTKETQQFKEAQKSLNQELKQAQTNPKKNAKLIKQLKEQIKGYTSSIELNKQKMKQLDRQMGLSNLSMTQLRRHLSDLNKQLNNVSQRLHPEEWKKLNDEILVTKGRINELNAESAILNKNSAMKTTALGNLISSMVMKIGSGLKELTEEGIKMAESADGVQRAFNKLNDPGLLDKLRAATKGTVNDLQLMQAAVRAKDFRIPLENLGKYLAYAQLKAQETGQSVEYLTDSIIMGLGRQSKQILDNLGLSATEISEEVAKTGDFVTGVTAIVDRQLEASGEAYVAAADKATRASVELENAQLRLGQAMLPLKERWNEATIYGAKLLTFLVENRKVTVPLISALLALVVAKAKFNATTITGNIAVKAQNILLKASKIAILAAKAAYNLLTGNLVRAAAAQKLLNAAIAANPFGAILTAVVALVSVIASFVRKANEASESVSVLDRVSRRMAEDEDTTAQKVRNLSKILHDNSKSIDLRRSALEELMKIVPGYQATLTEEGKLINENTAALQSYTATLIATAKAKAQQEELTDLYKKQLELQQKVAEGEAKLPGNNNGGSFRMKDVRQLREDRAELKKINSDIETLTTTIFEEEQAARQSGEEAAKPLIKELEEQRKALVEARDAATTEEDIAARNREIEQIDEKIQRLQDLGKTVKEQATAEKAVTSIISEEHSRRLESLSRMSDSETDAFRQMLQDKLISQEEHDALSAKSAVAAASRKLDMEKSMLSEIESMTFKTEDERTKAIADADKRIYDADRALKDAQLKEQQTLESNINALVKAGAEEREMTLDEQREAELTALDVYLKAALKLAGDNQEAASEAEEAYRKAVFDITRRYAEKEEELTAATEKEKQQIRQQLGLVSYRQELEMRLEALRSALDKEAITEQEYAAKVRDARISAWKEQYDRYQSLAASAFESLQQAEIDNSAAKYDILISQAKKAGQDTAALEEEKEAKQLEIQKKYADVNFAIKASQIIADTAVSIMKARADLGPIAGSIAAALTAVVGAAQLASANAERERVKQLQAGSAGATGGTRVLSGREKGGYISVRRRQDGRLFRDVEVDPDRRGYIDRPTVIVGEGARSKEWVASNAAVENPTVSPILDIIDRAQRAGSIRTLDLNKVIRSRLTGYADGGDIASARHLRRRQRDTADTVAIPDSGISTLEHLDETLRSLQRDGIPASVTLTELDRKRELRDRARKIGSKR